MGIEVPRQRHVPLVQIYGDTFEPEQPPSDDRPWMDDRAPATFPVVLGLVPHDDVRLRFRRIALPPDIPVRIVSRNPSVVQVAEPAGGLISSGDAEIRLTTGEPLSTGSEPASDDGNDVGIAVQCAGKMIHGISARVYELLRVPVHPVAVQVTPDGEILAGARATIPGIDDIEQGVNRYFRRIGVEMVFGEIQNVAVTGLYGRFRVIGPPYPELESAIRQAHHPNKLNLYFSRTFSAPNDSGVVVEDRTILGRYVSDTSRDNIVVKIEERPSSRLLSTIAHEIGHYFNLHHPMEHRSGTSIPASSGWFLMHWTSPGGRLIPLKWVTRHGAHRLLESQASAMRQTIRGRTWSL